ncbi:MAG: hypothetical protein VXW87_01555 [Pseudomonadota bacterium]|nr:hypothetical protein [Pseudomonadota bacterium]
MKKYILVLTAALSFALDATVSYGNLGLVDSYCEMYSIGVAQELSHEQSPVRLEVGGNVNYYVEPFWASDKHASQYNFSASAKLLFQFNENNAAFIGRSFHYLDKHNVVLRGSVYGYKRMISDTQSFSFALEAVESAPACRREDNCCDYDNGISMDPRLVITVAKTVI